VRHYFLHFIVSFIDGGRFTCLPLSAGVTDTLLASRVPFHTLHTGASGSSTTNVFYKSHFYEKCCCSQLIAICSSTELFLPVMKIQKELTQHFHHFVENAEETDLFFTKAVKR